MMNGFIQVMVRPRFVGYDNSEAVLASGPVQPEAKSRIPKEVLYGGQDAISLPVLVLRIMHG